MSEHLLYCTQVGPPFEQMCREAVTERVGGYRAVYTCCFCQTAYYGEYHLPCEPVAATVKKHNVLFSTLYFKGSA